MEVCKVEQHSQATTAVLHSRNSWLCQEVLRQAPGNHVLLYPTVSRWIQALEVCQLPLWIAVEVPCPFT